MTYRFPWPDAETLTAGDEDKVRDIEADILSPEILDPRETDDDDGHLEESDWLAKHPDQEP